MWQKVSVPSRGLSFYFLPIEIFDDLDEFPSPLGVFLFISDADIVKRIREEEVSVPSRGLSFYLYSI